MLISHKNRFIFIHNYKVAGVSIKNTLKGRCRKPGLFRLPDPYMNFEAHITADKLKKVLPEVIFNRYFKFGFVRDPWDWQVSLYSFMLDRPRHHQHKLIKSMSFDQYIDWRVHQELRLQKDFFCDQQGECLVDFVGKFENLNKDFNKICTRVGIKADLPHKNRSGHGRYLEYYNQKTIDMVAQAFKEDLQTFDYTKPEPITQ